MIFTIPVESEFNKITGLNEFLNFVDSRQSNLQNTNSSKHILQRISDINILRTVRNKVTGDIKEAIIRISYNVSGSAEPKTFAIAFSNVENTDNSLHFSIKANLFYGAKEVYPEFIQEEVYKVVWLWIENFLIPRNNHKEIILTIYRDFERFTSSFYNKRPVSLHTARELPFFFSNPHEDYMVGITKAFENIIIPTNNKLGILETKNNRLNYAVDCLLKLLRESYFIYHNNKIKPFNFNYATSQLKSETGFSWNIADSVVDFYLSADTELLTILLNNEVYKQLSVNDPAFVLSLSECLQNIVKDHSLKILLGRNEYNATKTLLFELITDFTVLFKNMSYSAETLYNIMKEFLKINNIASDPELVFKQFIYAENRTFEFDGVNAAFTGVFETFSFGKIKITMKYPNENKYSKPIVNIVPLH